MKLTDSSVKTGQSFEITGFDGDELYRERLHEMGLRKGMLLTILGRAPFNGPLLVRFHTSFLALRNEEAACTLIKPK
ncbi:FeoA family protein [Bdellovibrio sp. HCB2-146]|uniref:FeoA family protein n=1 Tax=Bdellovibrio sp. HCB2-146 TaxID=3394362 RepID=UPI0039BD0AB7